VDIVPQLIVNSLIAGSLYALVALGFNFIYGATRFFNLAHGAIAVAGGYIVYFFTKMLGWSAIPSIIIGLLVAGLLGYLSERFIYRPLRARKSSHMVLLVASLGVLTALQAIIAMLFTSQFQTLGQMDSVNRTFNIFGGVITQIQLIMFISVVVVMVGLAVILKFTFFGKSVRAISDDEEVARMVGINTNQVIGIVFFIGSALAGLSGILSGYDTGLEPTMGMSLLLKGVIASIIGGIGNVYGGVLGAFLLGFVENFGIWKISGEWKDAIAFGLLIIFLLLRPNGILGQKRS
jgi:branched-subunit amino acid ABC-type transport system permease component